MTIKTTVPGVTTTTPANERAPWVLHFGFTRTPLTKNVAAKDLFVRDSQAEAVARIHFCIAESALGVLFGDVGVGKTVAVRAAVAGLDRARHHVIYVSNPTFGCRGLYHAIVSALGGTPRFRKPELMSQASDLLAAEASERRRRVLVVIDEAHLLTQEQLEELRLLTNADFDSASPFAGLLVGQPTLARQLRLGVFAALDQRISTRLTLAPMSLDESARYLRHHLALVGRTDPLYADDAVARLHRASRGLPRALNNLATAALVAAAAEGKALVDDVCARQAVAEYTQD
jgi:type II secretory pathway predicted ATPase ExeA